MRLLVLSLREVLHNRAFTALFILNLSLGLTGLMGLEGFKEAISAKVSEQSRAILGGDLVVSARRALSPQELERVEKLLPPETARAQIIEMFSMISGPDGKSRLVQVKAIDPQFPFYGYIARQKQSSEKEDAPIERQSTTELRRDNLIWIYPELVNQLKLPLGSEAKIGEARFQVQAVVTEDAASGITANMAPRIYMDVQKLAQTKLLRQGSIAWHQWIFHLPQLDRNQLQKLRGDLFASLDNPDVRVATHEESSANTATLLGRLNDFLGLTSLVGLFLAGLGAAFLYRSYVRSKTKEMAILMALGSTRFGAFFFYGIQVFFLGLMSLVLAALLSWLLFPALVGVTKGLLPVEVTYRFSLMSLGFGFLLVVLGSLVVVLPTLVSIRHLQAASLLTDQRLLTPKAGLGALLALLPALILFLVLSILLSRSFMVGGLFTLGCLLAFLALGLLGQGVLLVLPRLKLKPIWWTWAVRDMVCYRTISLIAFSSMGLGSLLLNLIPQVQTSLASELDRPDVSKVPSLFLFDIQEEQIEPLQEILQAEGLKLDQLSPTIQSRLIAINGRDFDKGKGEGQSFSREEEAEMRFRNRGFNLSYREELSDSESLVSGRPFSGIYSEAQKGLPEISMEVRFAKRLGFQIGDRLTFDIEGVPLEGEIINLRRVRWTSFQPNFFVQFQPGVLQDAPKAFIATLPPVPLAEKLRVQDLLVEKLPNVSLIDVGRVVEQLLRLIDQMSWALFLMSGLCLFAGLVVIYSMASHQARERRWDIRLLKVLGAPFQAVERCFLIQFALMAVMGALTGAILSLGFSYFASRLLFEGLWVFNAQVPALSVLTIAVLALLVSQRATRRVLAERATLLNQNQ